MIFFLNFIPKSYIVVVKYKSSYIAHALSFDKFSYMNVNVNKYWTARSYATIVGAVRATYIVFGSDSSKSTKFGTNIAQAILFRFLKGAKTSDPWSRHIGKFNMAAKQIEG